MNSYAQNRYNLKKSKQIKNIKINKIKLNKNYSVSKEMFVSKEMSLGEDIDNYFDYYKKNVYLFDYNNLNQISIDKHIFNLIYLISYSKQNVSISRNGDLCYKMYLKIDLPEFKNDSKIINTAIPKGINKLYIYDLTTINFENYVFPDSLEELYIYNEYFNQPIKNLPNGLKFLSICSKELTINLDNLPCGLEYLFINCPDFNQPINNLPPNLKVLSIISKNFNNSLNNLPQGLKILNLKSIHICNFNNLPESLEYLYVNIISKEELFDLPSGLKYLSLNILINNYNEHPSLNYNEHPSFNYSLQKEIDLDSNLLKNLPFCFYISKNAFQNAFQNNFGEKMTIKII
jgi:hypothetical protein